MGRCKAKKKNRENSDDGNTKYFQGSEADGHGSRSVGVFFDLGLHFGDPVLALLLDLAALQPEVGVYHLNEEGIDRVTHAPNQDFHNETITCDGPVSLVSYFNEKT